jgi:hypothetical protein
VRGSVPATSTMLSENNLIRSRKIEPAPIRRSDSSRIETWRDEVNCCCSSGTATPELEEKEHRGKLSKLTKHLRRKTNESLQSGKGEVPRTSMYDGSKEGERRLDDWEEGAGESMYLGSLNSADGRLDRAEALLSRGCGEDEKKVHEQVKGVQQATA